MPARQGSMEALYPIEFTTALSHLAGMIGEEINVVFNHYGYFFGGGMKGRLEYVQTLPPDNAAVQLVIEGGQGLFLDPAEVRTYLGGGDAEGRSWLEFSLPAGLSVQVELVAGAAS